MPTARAASNWPFGNGQDGPADRLGEIRGGEDGQHENARRRRGDSDAEARQGEEDQEGLHQERRVADDLDETGRGPPEERGSRQPSERDHRGERQTEDDRTVQKKTVLRRPLSRIGSPNQKTERSKSMAVLSAFAARAWLVRGGSSGRRGQAHDEIEDADSRPDFNRLEGRGDDLLGRAREFHHPDHRQERRS